MQLESLCQAGAAQEEATRGELRAAMEREHAEQLDQLQVGSSSCCVPTVQSTGRSACAVAVIPDDAMSGQLVPG